MDDGQSGILSFLFCHCYMEKNLCFIHRSSYEPLCGFSNLRPTLCRTFHCDIPLDGRRSSEEALFNGYMTRVNCAGRRTWPSGVRDGIARWFFSATTERKRLHPEALALRVTTQRVGLDPSFSGCHFPSHAAITLASCGHAKLAWRLQRAVVEWLRSRCPVSWSWWCGAGGLIKGHRSFVDPKGLEIAAPYTFVGALLLTLTCRQSFVDRWGAGLSPAVLCPGLSYSYYCIV